MPFDLTKLRKLEAPSPKRAAVGVQGTVTAIIKVNRSGYRPDGVEIRSEIDGEMFTAEFPAQLLEKLERDKYITSMSLSRPLQTQAQ